MNAEQLKQGNKLTKNIAFREAKIKTLQLLLSTVETSSIAISRNQLREILDPNAAKVALILQLDIEQDKLQRLQQELAAI